MALAPRSLLGAFLIVKDEAATIVPTVAQNERWVDVFTVLDTGSGDETPALLERLREALGPDRVRLFSEPFVDFAASKNRALELHVNAPDGQRTRFAVNLDADEYLVDGPRWRRHLESLEADAAAAAADLFLVTIDFRTKLRYKYPRLFRCDTEAGYRGRVHEVPRGERLLSDASARECRIYHSVEHNHLGGSGERWRRDIPALEADHAERPDDPRPVFYLAQTYYDRGGVGDDGRAYDAAALRWYERRLAMGGWRDERVVALLRCGEIRARRGEIDLARACFEAAFALDPRRAEALCWLADLALHYAPGGAPDWPRAYLYALAAWQRRDSPPGDALFLDLDAYGRKGPMYLSMAGFYAGDGRNGRAAAEYMVALEPGSAQWRANLAFYAAE